MHTSQETSVSDASGAGFGSRLVEMHCNGKRYESNNYTIDDCDYFHYGSSNCQYGEDIYLSCTHGTYFDEQFYFDLLVLESSVMQFTGGGARIQLLLRKRPQGNTQLSLYLPWFSIYRRKYPVNREENKW